ncbi:MAG: restriction endonuclease subunit S [Candidatus Methanoperedens sp.]|nr:restriction endonuclease subunit S [Candidatus Methanoperedens sp.]
MIQKQEFIETEIGRIPGDWNFDKLGNHLVIKGRIGWKGLKKSEYLREGYAIINGEQIINDSVDWDSCGRITKERYEESPEIMLKENDILMTKDGTIGKLAYIRELKEPSTVASGVFVIRNNSANLYQKYLYYVFKSNFFKNLVESRVEGSVVPHLYQRDIVDLKIPLPPIQEQRQIAEIFLCLDSKIALNRSMNSTLEAIGQALFKHWFVDFEFPNEEGKPYRSSGGEMVETELGEVPGGWEVKPFSEVIDVNPNRKLVKNTIAKKVGMADLNAWQSWVESWQSEEYKSGPRFQNGDTLFARITPSLEHGKTAFVSSLDKDEVAFGSTEFIIFAHKVIQSNLLMFTQPT